MKGKLHVVFGVLFVLALAYDLFLWGGVAHTRRLGPVIAQTTLHEPTLAGVYLSSGRMLNGAIGLQSSAGDFAQSTFEAMESRVLANPATAMDTLLGHLPFGVMLAYYGAPLLLVAFLIAWWRRPRAVHSMGR